jgi:hypothetical protein
MIGIDLARALDPALIAKDVGIELDDWQASLMRSNAPRVLMCCARQTGKSTVSCLIALWTAVSMAGSLILLVSPSQRQSGELFRTLMSYLRKLPGAPDVRAESALRVELANGSRVIALPGDEKTIRGYAGPALILLDEAARVEQTLLAALRPMLSVSHGRLIALSTPRGKNNWFCTAWHGDDSWHRVRVPAAECPRITQAFLDEELRELGEQRFAEEYQLAFIEDGDQVIRTEFFDRAVSKEVTRLWA